MKIVASMSIVVLALGLQFGCVSRAQNWKSKVVNDPISQTSSTMFFIDGSGYNENIPAVQMGVSCENGKHGNAGITMQEYVFARNGILPAFTLVDWRIGETQAQANLPLSSDSKIAFVLIKDFDKMVLSDSAYIRFSDGLGSPHTIEFHGLLPDETMASMCGLHKQ